MVLVWFSKDLKIVYYICRARNRPTVRERLMVSLSNVINVKVTMNEQMYDTQLRAKRIA